jgi:hypothetical protein
MKITLSFVLLCCMATFAAAGDDASRQDHIVLQKLQGDVTVRHGVMEAWTHVAAGDVLRPDDSMKIGKKGAALLVVQMTKGETTTTKKISLPAEVIVDISDIRELTQEELMLKLTMEKVRASSYQWRNDEMQMPNTSVVHGQNQSQTVSPGENDPQTGDLFLNGTRVLFDNGFYSTCALKVMELFRLYPPLAMKFENRLMMADALGKAGLRSEALAQYSELAHFDGLSAQQQAAVNGRVAQLKK